MSFITTPVTLQNLFGSKRLIGPIEAQVVLNEETNDTLTITKQPVQTGASITDHAFKEPTVFKMDVLQKDNNVISGLLDTFAGPGAGGLAQLYQTFLDLQNSREPFNIFTPKRIYKNMLISVLSLTTDRKTEYILALHLTFQEVILVSVGIVQVPTSRQKTPKKTQATQRTGQKSALLSIAQGINPNTVGASQ